MKGSRPTAVWKESYRIGVPLLDAEHKNLFLAINTYIESLQLNQGARYSIAVIDTIVDYAKTHFEREETLMHERRYPHLTEHRLSHTNFLIVVEDYKRLILGGFGIADELGLFLSDWITNHEINADHQMKLYFESAATKNVEC